MRYQPLSFRTVPGTPVCRIDFQNGAEAQAFAEAFGGEMLRASAV